MSRVELKSRRQSFLIEFVIEGRKKLLLLLREGKNLLLCVRYEPRQKGEKAIRERT